jgi:DNA-binding PadR family transcriptional regulator
VFEQGDLKYVILQLLEEKPRHGYEIIKELEDRFGGMYSPSPGTVYPTLTMLEDLGYARATPEEGGRKIYEITDEGRRYLAENRGTVDDIFARIAQFGASFFSDAMMSVNAGLGELARSVYGAASRRPRDAEWARKVRDVLDRAAKEIDELGR